MALLAKHALAQRNLRRSGRRFLLDSGQIESEANYVDGKATGTWTFYHENGKRASQGEMLEGKKEGAWRYFNSSGRLVDIINYQADEIVEQINSDPDTTFSF